MQSFKTFTAEDIDYGNIRTTLSATPVTGEAYHGNSTDLLAEDGFYQLRRTKIFLSSTSLTASMFGKYVYIMEINFQHPLIMDCKGADWDAIVHNLAIHSKWHDFSKPQNPKTPFILIQIEQNFSKPYNYSYKNGSH